MRFPLERNYEFSAIPTGGTVDQRYYMITRSTNRWPPIRSQSFVSNRLTSRELRAPWVYVYAARGFGFRGRGEGGLQKLHESSGPCIPSTTRTNPNTFQFTSHLVFENQFSNENFYTRKFYIRRSETINV